MNGLALTFYQKLIQLSVKDQVNFKRIVNKLLRVNYLTSQKQSDANDYFFITTNYELLKTFFMLMDCELILDLKFSVIALYNKQDTNYLNLRLNETIILLILRVYYEEKVKATTKVTISIAEVYEKLASTGLKERRINKTELQKILSLFSHYNLIEVINKSRFTEKTQIILYPSLLYVVNYEDINKIYDQLYTYQKSGDNHETIKKD